MGRTEAIIGSLMFLILAPGTVAGVGPWMITDWRFAGPQDPGTAQRWLGTVIVALGAIPLLDSFRRFAVEGLGTPSPAAPPNRLIATGFYQHVRNPMYIGLIMMIAGQAVLFSSGDLLLYAATIAVAFHLFVTLYEEPHLRARFGESYNLYCRNVSRWWPRVNAWSG